MPEKTGRKHSLVVGLEQPVETMCDPDTGERGKCSAGLGDVDQYVVEWVRFLSAVQGFLHLGLCD